MKRLLGWILGGIAMLALVAAGLLYIADTGVGHRFIADRIARIAPHSGLRIRIGRIEGSIYGKARIVDLRLSDPNGVFFEAGSVTLDWRPWSYAANLLDIDSLTAPAATLHRLPKLVPSEKPQPILPDFDIQIGTLRIDRLTVGERIAKPARVGRLNGRADFRGGRALIDLEARMTGGDRIALKLDANPDRNVFDLGATVDAPARGVIGSMVGTDRPLMLRVDGDGSWTNWQGRLAAHASGQEIANLALAVHSGRYDLDGVIRPALLTRGRVQRLTGPSVRVKGNARLEDRRLDTHLALASGALAVGANGIVDLAQSSLDGMKIDARLLSPRALFPDMTGRDIRLKILLDGAFATARFDYLLTAPHVAFATTGFDQVRVAGRGRLSAQPVIVPVALSARRVTGVGSVVGGILNNLRVDGLLRVTSKMIMGDGLKLRSDKLTSTVTLLVDLVTGRYDVSLSGQLGRFYIPGLGIVDVKSTLKVVPGPNGRGTRVTGRGQAWVRRFDNAFLASLAGGLPSVDTALERTSDGIIHFTGLRLIAPAIAITGNGYRRRDGSFHFEGIGRQRQYGPFKLILDGPIDRPKLDIQLPRPLDAAGVKDVHLLLDPTLQGFTWRATGGSTIGPFTGNGQILLPKGGAAIIRVADLLASGAHVTGDLHAVTGGLDGTLAMSGAGTSGTLALAAPGGIQRIEAHVGLNGVRLAGPPLLSVRRGQIDLVALLDPKGASVDGTMEARGVRRGGIAFSRLNATVEMRGGTGEVRSQISGGRGRLFVLDTLVRIEPGRFTVSGGGTLDRQPIKLDTPAVVLAEGQGWRLQPVTLSYAGGLAKIAGRLGGEATAIDATVERLPLAVLDIINADLGLGGTASGRFDYQQAGEGAPTGTAEIRVRNLTRSGLTLGSKPIDAGVNAVLRSDALAFRAVVASGGQTVGQAQGRVGLADGDLTRRVMDGTLFAQVRYNGPADTLWRMTGVETFDISGPVAIGADFSGKVSDPDIRGSLKTDNLRIESPLSGTVLTGLKGTGTFAGSKLVIDSFTANAGRGTVTGRATFDLAAARGFGIDIAADARNAQLIARDELQATATGPIRIVSDGAVGTISGNVTLNRSGFVLGRTTAVAQVPKLKVTEINLRGRRQEADDRPAASMVWQLDLKATAPNQMLVTGLGLDSEWQADLTVKGTLAEPNILGRADLVRGGYEFAGRRFDLTRGMIRFQGVYPPDPVIDITANASVQSLTATIQVSGTGQRPQISFASTPAMPQDELLSRLLFGTSITNLSAPEALQLGAAVASLQGGGGLDPINAVRRAVGLDRLRIVGADTTTGAKTSVAAGKYLTRRTYVEVITDGQGYSATRIEFAITRWLSLLSSISTIGKQSASVRVSKDY